MKNKGLSLVLITVLSLSLTACSKAENGTATNNTTSQTEQSGSQQPIKQADLYGEVSDIVGNEVTLKLIKMPERPNSTAYPNQNNSDGAPGGGQGRPSDRQGNPGSEQSNPDGNQSNPNNEMTNRVQMQREYTGEVKSIIIPVGLKITTQSRGQGRTPQSGTTQGGTTQGGGTQSAPAETEVKLESIKIGNVLQIYYAEDGKTIDKIMVSTQMGGRTNAPNAASN